MQLQQSVAPHFRQRESVKDIMAVLLICCAVLTVPAVVRFGFRAVIMALSGILGAALTEWAWQWFGNREPTVGDLTAVTTGFMCALLLPPQLPVWAPALTAAFAVGAAKLPFGGPGRSAFNPAAAGGCFAVLCWANFKNVYSGAKSSLLYQGLAEKCFGYIGGKLPAFGSVAAAGQSISESVSPVVLLGSGLHNTVSSSDAIALACDPGLSFSDFLFGGFSGSMGASFAVLVIICGVFAALFGSCAWHSSLSFIAAVAIFSSISGYTGIPAMLSPVYDIFTGATLFAAFFLAGDIFTAPHMRSGRLLYGAGCGLLTVILRRIGAVEYCEFFAVMLMNPLAPAIDRLVWRARQRGISFYATRKKLARKLRKKLHIGDSPFDSFDFDDDDDDAEVYDGSDI